MDKQGFTEKEALTNMRSMIGDIDELTPSSFNEFAITEALANDGYITTKIKRDGANRPYYHTDIVITEVGMQVFDAYSRGSRYDVYRLADYGFALGKMRHQHRTTRPYDWEAQMVKFINESVAIPKTAKWEDIPKYSGYLPKTELHSYDTIGCLHYTDCDGEPAAIHIAGFMNTNGEGLECVAPNGDRFGIRADAVRELILFIDVRVRRGAE